MNIIKTNDPHALANDIVTKIKSEIATDKKILWFVAGGSSMAVAVLASRELVDSRNIAVVLTDERYGLPDDPDSNERQLKDLGFALPITSVLLGGSKEQTTESFARSMEKTLLESDIVIGLFGVGADGHVAGIMPESPATMPNIDYAVGYQAPTFYRLTITPAVIARMDATYLWMQGEAKKEALERLLNDYPANSQPGQYLKTSKEFSIYTDIKI